MAKTKKKIVEKIEEVSIIYTMKKDKFALDPSVYANN